MRRGNQTTISKFILLGLTSDVKKKILMFAIFLLLYVLSVIGNIGMMLAIRLTPQLQTPMYYFISNLSCIDFFMSSVIVPKTLQNLLADEASISLFGCAAQMYGLIFSGCADSFLLSLMAYDRYIAICHPLHYTGLMSKQYCLKLVVLSYASSLLYSTTLTVPTMCLRFCGSNTIQHFICEIPSLLQLACADTQPHSILLFTLGGIFTASFLTTIIISYIYILSTIMKLRSIASRLKTFSTCGSHLLTVSLLYGTVAMMYFWPTSGSGLAHGGIMSVFYTVIIPVLNPVIYSVRNKEVKEALKAMACRLFFYKTG